MMKKSERDIDNNLQGGSYGNGGCTVIAKGSEFTGDIKSDSDVIIYGKYIGSIKTSTVVNVEAGGELDGKIDAAQAIISGKVTGKIKASSKVDIRETAVVDGEVTTPRLVVEEGSMFLGKVQMN